MIRSFTLRDIPLVHRLSDRGIVFHAESALTQSVRPLREALVHMLIGGQFPTYVWKEDKGEAVGFAQLRQDEDESLAHILCLGSTENGDDLAAVWLPFLEQLIAEAGRQGIQSLIAEVSEDGEELPILRRAGFAVYTRQDVWVIQTSPPALEVSQSHDLVKATSVDEWDVHLLYANTVPRLIQLVEPIPPSYIDKVWVLRENNGELAAFVHFNDGPAATWLRVFIHPNTELAGDEIVTAALRVMPPKPKHPIYCCVRRYQSWVQNALQKVGFEYTSSQAMMVRHTVHHTRKLVPDLAADVNAQAAMIRRNLFSDNKKRERKRIKYTNGRKKEKIQFENDRS